MTTIRHILEITVSVLLMLAVAMAVIALSYLHFQTVEASPSILYKLTESQLSDE